MGPARAMGTFLRVWRSEWAQLSRAQLAIAVSAQMPNGKAVTPRGIRWWEEGNPPGSTEEFEGLCDVMRRNGLSRPEVEDFRKAVLAACLDRQYPELFPDEAWVHQHNLAAAACAIHGQIASGGPDLNRVQLVSLIQELESAISGPAGTGASRAQRDDWHAALVYLLRSLSECHRYGMRWHQSAITCMREATLLDAHFDGKGPGCALSSPIARTLAFADRAMADGAPEALWGIFDTAREALASGAQEDAGLVFALGVGYSWLGTADQREYVRHHMEEYRAILGPDHWIVKDNQWALCMGALYDGLLGQAEGCLESFQPWEHAPGRQREHWARAMGLFALASGRPAEAEGYFEIQLNVCKRLRDTLGERLALGSLRDCEEARPRAANGSTQRDKGKSRRTRSAAKKPKGKSKPLVEDR